MLDEREAQRKLRMLQREDYEKSNCGQYELIYPIVSYQEEFEILAKQADLLNEEKATVEEESSEDEGKKNTPWDQ